MNTDKIALIQARLAAIDTERERLNAELERLRESTAEATPAIQTTGNSEHCPESHFDPEASSKHAVAEARRAVPLSPTDKITLFRTRFAGRDDLFAQRWESRDGTRAGYAPACANEWRAGICEKPRVKCHECRHRDFVPMSDAVVRDHLTGARTVGRYALDSASRCRFVVADFDHDDWREDVMALLRTCHRLDVPVLAEISRSGDGAHAWFFFDAPVPAAHARRLATALIERTCREERLLSLASHDRLIPGQDALSGAGFGSLVALPLQQEPRTRGASVFVDDALEPVANPWAALASTPAIRAGALSALTSRVEAGHPGLASILRDPSTDDSPWNASTARRCATSMPIDGMPPSIQITLADGIYVDRTALPQPAVYAVARLAAFANPHWFELTRANRSTWNTPRFVEKAEALPKHVRIPRGCFDALTSWLDGEGTSVRIDDKRESGQSLGIRFKGALRPDQRAAARDLLAQDTGVLHAPPGFGKTVTAAWLIAERERSTLVIVHTMALLSQWRKSLANFLGRPLKTIGRFGGPDKHLTTGEIDIASVQALARLDDDALETLLRGYGHVIVDECHHAGSASCTRVLGLTRARYVMGLSATPERRDGLEPLVYLLCGPIRHRAKVPVETPVDRSVDMLDWERIPDVAENVSIQTLLSAVAEDTERTAFIAQAVARALHTGRKVLVLTERRAHVDAIVAALATATDETAPRPIVLHGQLPGKARREAFETLEALGPDEPRCVVATGRFVGEGFDHAALDALVFAMPFAWRGTLAQYVGRLSRPAPGKGNARVMDVRDTGHPMLMSMARKRLLGYRALGWREEDGGSLF